ncbi:hypothetical protein DPEC_G00315870 [Dallia pectoralis]|uniref:Uncharacterized protein n=1 Tax=Dallia pectoralis TaxID=75939 RepID=A0ACC2FCK1_DALPE|nr:hypothetical protein DPEC_G00315870 [Dallia pectoralis]
MIVCVAQLSRGHVCPFIKVRFECEQGHTLVNQLSRLVRLPMSAEEPELHVCAHAEPQTREGAAPVMESPTSLDLTKEPHPFPKRSDTKTLVAVTRHY